MRQFLRLIGLVLMVLWSQAAYAQGILSQLQESDDGLIHISNGSGSSQAYSADGVFGNICSGTLSANSSTTCSAGGNYWAEISGSVDSYIIYQSAEFHATSPTGFDQRYEQTRIGVAITNFSESAITVTIRVWISPPFSYYQSVVFLGAGASFGAFIDEFYGIESVPSGARIDIYAEDSIGILWTVCTSGVCSQI